MVGPDFHRPLAPHVEHFTQRNDPVATVSADGVAQTFAAAAAVPSDWWTLFHAKPIDDAVDQALAGSATLDAAQAALRQSQDLLRAGAGVFFPQIDAGAGVSRQKFSPFGVGTIANGTIFNLFTWSASVSYVLDISGGERRRVEALSADVDAQRQALLATYLTLSANVVNTMIARAAYTDELAATREMVDLLQQQITLTERQAAAGTVPYLSVVSLQSEKATLEASVPALAQKLEQAEDLLATLSGQLPAEWHAPPLSLSEVALPATLPKAVPSKLVHRRPDILLAEAQLHSASAGIGVASAALYPSVTLNGGLGADGRRLGEILRKSGSFWSLGTSIAAPVFHGGTLRAQRQAAIDAYGVSQANYRQTVLAAFAQVADSLRALEHDASALEAQSRALAASREALRLVRISYEAGTVNYLQILIADGQYHAARIAYFQDVAQRLQDTVALFVALGGSWTNDE